MIVGLFVITAALYSKAAYFPFCIIDDTDYVRKNIHVASGLSLDSITWAFTAYHASNWHPVTWLSLMLDSQLFGNNPMGFHLVNIFLHALNTSLLFLLFNSMTGAVWRSAFVAACFAVHPLHVESVAWITERKDVLSTLFWLLALLFYYYYVKRSSRSMYLFSLVTFALGLMAKPMLVTTPVILLLLDFWPLARLKNGVINRVEHQAGGQAANHFKLLLLEKLPFVLLAAGSSIVTMYAQENCMSTLAEVPILLRVSNALWALVLYMAKTVFPFNLSVFYPLAQVSLWQTGCAAGILCGIAFTVLKQKDRYPYLAAGWFLFLITLLPVLGIIQVGSQSMADRYSYIPLIGLFVMASWGGAELYEKNPKLKNLIGAVAAGVLLFFAVITWNQLGYWRDNVILMRHAIETTENNAYAHCALGFTYDQLGEKDRAFEEYWEVLKIDPTYADSQYHNNFAILLYQRGMLEDAIKHFRFALQLNPDDEKAEINLQAILKIKNQLTKK